MASKNALNITRQVVKSFYRQAFQYEVQWISISGHRYSFLGKAASLRKFRGRQNPGAEFVQGTGTSFA
jgi:hypothetical protein